MKCENDTCEARSSHGDCCSMVWVKDKKDCPYFQLYEARAALMEWGSWKAKREMVGHKRMANYWLSSYRNSMFLRMPKSASYEWKRFVRSMAEYANLEFMLERAKQS